MVGVELQKNSIKTNSQTLHSMLHKGEQPPPAVIQAPVIVPTSALNPAPADAMEVDAAYRCAPTAILCCYQCGHTGHLYHDCPNAADVQFLNIDEIDEEVRRLLFLKRDDHN
ncbi:hypothetical protein Clacol_006081 [Clathrus columnatus]|uniref:CCHC-type domain-containing protein n=1 Tax=Clathrus columnatus TaxID=1419009 RepID=A0AAV5AFD3_9AGAM|nr:hypothetical protein Clacol_006081 [Clathrus columnatus]